MFMVEVVAFYRWVPDGMGSQLGPQQANSPGYGATAIPGTVPAAQEASDRVGEIVPGGDSPTTANFQTALNNGAADLYTRFTTSAAVPGFAPSGTLAAIVQAWSTGGP